jgi:hypothetical protein
MDPLRPGITDEHRAGEAGAVDLHPAGLSPLEVGADEPGRPPLEHLDDLAGGSRPADVAAAGQPHADGIAVGRVEAGGGRDVDVGRAIAG